MFSWLLFHFILIPLSWLPTAILYFLSRFAYFIVYKLIGYRKAVVYDNLKRSFPEKSKTEIDSIAKEFYKHLANLLAESIKNLSISKTALTKRMTVTNPEVMDQLYEDNKSVILLGSHIYNWEYLITAQNICFKHQAIGIGTPLTNAILNRKINNKRSRFGMIITTNENYKSVITTHQNTPTATLILGDQSPSKAVNAFWTTFLNRETPFFFGAEIMANQMDAAVVYCQITIAKKGHYSITLKEITKTPLTEPYGKVLKKYVTYLEEDVNESPAYWLWSHRRWKMEVPLDLPTMKVAHKNRFESKFRAKKLLND